MREGVIYIESRFLIGKKKKKSIPKYLGMFHYGCSVACPLEVISGWQVLLQKLFFSPREKHLFNQAPGKE